VLGVCVVHDCFLPPLLLLVLLLVLLVLVVVIWLFSCVAWS
jgi:hypothetical protein